MLSEAVKILKGEYAVRAIKAHNMDKAIVFCRTKVDCDNMENYLNTAGGGGNVTIVSVFTVCPLKTSASEPPGLAVNTSGEDTANLFVINV